MSDDKYSKRLESLFSHVEPVAPEPGHPAAPPQDAHAQVRIAELEAAVAEARQQAEQEHAQRLAASAALENLKAQTAKVEAEAPVQTSAEGPETAPSRASRLRSAIQPLVPRRQASEADKVQTRARNAWRMAVILLVTLAVFDVNSIYNILQTQAPQQWVAAGLSFAASLGSITSMVDAYGLVHTTGFLDISAGDFDFLTAFVSLLLSVAARSSVSPTWPGDGLVPSFRTSTASGCGWTSSTFSANAQGERTNVPHSANTMLGITLVGRVFIVAPERCLRNCPRRRMLPAFEVPSSIFLRSAPWPPT